MIPTAALLEGDDRCHLRGHYLSRWEAHRMNPHDALYRAVEEGLTTEEDDPGKVAGDTLYTYALDRGFELPEKIEDLFGHGQHLASLADMVTYVLRTGSPWARPEPKMVHGYPWEPSGFISGDSERLRRVVLTSYWQPEVEFRSWRVVGEMLAYGLPMTLTVVVLGQNRGGRYHGPWTKAWRHPVSKTVRMRKKDGEGFKGSWKPIFRETEDISREMWLEIMSEDLVLPDCLFEVEVPPLTAHQQSKIGQVMRQKLEEMKRISDISNMGERIGLDTTPLPNMSQCMQPSRCPYGCWEGFEPSVKTGFIKLK